MRTLLSSTIVLMLACSSSIQSGPDAAGISLTAAPTPAMAGDSVTLTLDNSTDGQIGYNLCASSLEQQTASGWEVVPSDVVCTMELRTLEAGSEVEYRTHLPAELAEGQYRYRTNVEIMSTGDYRSVTSNAFRVNT
ncbi:MAG TPA: immunoglobulin-like domain-containing protein [Longimicrobiales bacterium]|nr:immunoglobulin-like domain-containing protein [Longimicrobiales bacterium]